MRTDLEEKRRRRIRVVENTLIRAKDKGISINYENFISEVTARFEVSRRKSMEYIQTAADKLGWILAKVNGIKELYHKSLNYDQILNKNSKEWNNLTPEDKSLILEA